MGIHLVPGIEEHQSWVYFQLDEVPSKLLFCVDGRELSDDSDPPENGIVAMAVQTRLADLWLAGLLLPEYGNQSHWELRYRSAPD